MIWIDSIQRYPVKGLTGQELTSVDLVPGAAIPGDRAFALRHGETMFDPAAPKHLSKTKFLALMTHARLAALRAEFDADGKHMTLFEGAVPVFDANLATSGGRAAAGAFFDSFMGGEAKGSPQLVAAPGHMFSDVPEKCLSILNLASVEALSAKVGARLDPLRFRANIHLAGLPAWAERDWQNGMEVTIGGMRLKVMKQIVRCNATNVNLETANYDQNLPKVLAQEFAANLMGVYATVESPGRIEAGDRFTLVTG